MSPAPDGTFAPRLLEAREPPEARGLARDEVRLLVSGRHGTTPARFADLPRLLHRGDLLVANQSATIPASLPAESDLGAITVNVSTEYGGGLWLVEPRRGRGVPGPLPFSPGDRIRLAGLDARVVAPYPGISRLVFLRCEGDLGRRMLEVGQPVEYGHLRGSYPLSTYQTIFARVPGSTEMPSAGRPFSTRTLRDLEVAGIGLASITLHTGVSSLELGDVRPGFLPVFPEPYEVGPEVSERANRARATGHRVIAVGTSVVRALESAWDGTMLRGARGFTRAYVDSSNPPRAVDGILSGFHDARSTHLALIGAFMGDDRMVEAYRTASARGYLWHEFGDSHLALN